MCLLQFILTFQRRSDEIFHRVHVEIGPIVFLNGHFFEEVVRGAVIDCIFVGIGHVAETQAVDLRRRKEWDVPIERDAMLYLDVDDTDLVAALSQFFLCRFVFVFQMHDVLFDLGQRCFGHSDRLA